MSILMRRLAVGARAMGMALVVAATFETAPLAGPESAQVAAQEIYHESPNARPSISRENPEAFGLIGHPQWLRFAVP